MLVLEVDQWTSTGNVIGRAIEDFRLEDVQGGDAKAVRDLGIACARLREVGDTARPSTGYVWFRPDEDGKLVFYRATYDSSD